jgi:octaprenyl-diphosphate synthase
MGKNVGDDLAEGKPTLPLIQAMKLLPDSDAELIRVAIRTGGLEHIDRIVTMVRDCGALDYTMARAREESRLALVALADVPASPWREALEDLTKLALTRSS